MDYKSGEREDSGKITFSEAELKSIIPEEGGSYTNVTAEERLRDTVDNFDIRLEQFIHDVLFLYESYLEGEDIIDGHEWHDLLCQLEGVEVPDVDVSHEDYWSYDIWFSKTIREDEGDIGQLRLGVALAQLVRPIYRISHSSLLDNKGYYSDVVWGFIIGLVSESPEEHPLEIKQLEQIVSEIENRKERREIEAQGLVDLGPYQELHEEEYRAIKELGYSPTKPLVSAIGSKKREIAKESKKAFLPDENKHEEIKHRIWEAISRLRKETIFNNINILLKIIRWDEERIKDVKWNNVEAKSIFRIIYSVDHSVSPVDIADELGANGDEVMKIINDLSGRNIGTVGYDWRDPPLLQEEGGGKWQLTSYGTLVAEVMFDDGIKQLHAFALEEENDDIELAGEISEVIKKWSIE